MANYYEVLGVSPDATKEQIDRAFRSISSRLHPDRPHEDPRAARREFAEAQKAYFALRDGESRLVYNSEHMRQKSGWFLLPADTPIGDWRFNTDGTFDISGQSFRIDQPLDASLGPADGNILYTATKAAGVKEEIVCSGPGINMRYRFHNKRWYCWMPMKPGATSTAASEDYKSNGSATADRPKAEATRGEDSHKPSNSLVVYRKPKASPSSRSFGPLAKRLATAGVICLALVIGWMMRGLQHTGPNPNTTEFLSPEEIAERERIAELQAQQFELEAREKEQLDRQLAAETRRKLEIAKNRDRLLTLVRQGDDLLRLHSDLTASREEWDRLSTSLLTNEAGRKIAASPEHVRAFTAETNKQKPSEAAVSAIRTEVEKLLLPLREAAAAAEPAYSPAQDIEQTLERKKAEILALQGEYRKSLALLQALADSGSSPAAVSLSDAISDLNRTDELARAEFIARETDEVRRKRVAAEAERAKREQEDELARRQQLAASESRKRAQQLEHEQLVEEAQSREVRRALSYFFAKDTIQPEPPQGTSGIRQAQMAESLPISYSRLETLGALRTDATGLQMFHELVTKSFDQHRPKWGISPHFNQLTDTDIERIKQAQDYLIRLGPTLVELKLLSE